MPEKVHFSRELNSVYVNSFGKVELGDVEQLINEVSEYSVTKVNYQNEMMNFCSNQGSPGTVSQSY